ncbi:hypothetical protein ACIBH1_05365 [Nonomuraea sp. NPDC050663]|uniref:hypothetical protein n=1 Tax=Nonomuraea sp. NPDC050663 TaxID=3364370 RepID=UPI003792FA0E
MAKKGSGLQRAERQLAAAKAAASKAEKSSSYLRALHVRQAQRAVAEAQQTVRVWGGSA